MKRVVFAALFSGLGVSACATMQPEAMTATFDSASVAWFNQAGPNSISGSALLRTVGGEPRTCAALEVKLFPVSPYAEERMTKLYASASSGFNSANWLEKRGGNLAEADPTFASTSKTTRCDAQGKFRFADLPDGSYYVVAPVIWKANPNSFSDEGGMLMQRVDVKGGRAEEIVLSQ